MDSDRFDALTRALAGRTDRRSFVGRAIAGVLGGGVALRGAAASADHDCARFCLHLPPGQRGQCTSDCQHGTGPYADCAGDTTRLCPATDGTTVSCCDPGVPCVNGSCAPVCQSWQDYCEATGQCVDTLCGSNPTKVYNPATCACECKPGYVPLVHTGACAWPCESDADCAYGQAGSCKTTTEGQQVCANCGYSGYPGCTDSYPCEDSTFCQTCASAVNTYCAEGMCYTACPNPNGNPW